jgi:hypothetical protein
MIKSQIFLDGKFGTVASPKNSAPNTAAEMGRPCLMYGSKAGANECNM